MAELIPWVVIVLLAIFGVFMIARERPMTQQEYDTQKEQGNALGSALSEIQEILVPSTAEYMREAKDEQREEGDASGDPPDPGEPDDTGRRRR